MPYYLVLGTTTACPLNCVMCSRDSVISQAKRLALSDYQKLIDTIQPLQVSVGDLGESLFDADLDKKIRYAKKQGAVVDVVTSYAISRISPQDLIESGLDVLKVSIDGATAETYEAIRGEPYFEQALQHTRALIELRKKLGGQTPYVYLQFVLQRQSYEEMVDYVRLAAEIGADRIDYKPLIMDVERTGRSRLVGDMTSDRIYALLQEADQLAVSLGLRTNAPVLTPTTLQRHWAIYDGKDSRPQDLKRCMLPWYSTYVAADGNVYGCCILRFQDTEVLGNIHENDFASIWNGEAYQEFRRRMRELPPGAGPMGRAFPQIGYDGWRCKKASKM